jgi:hypothetical protein
MPARKFIVDLTTAGPHQIARPGEIINSMWIVSGPAGASLELDLGQNKDLPIGIGSVTFGDSPAKDRENGVWLHTEGGALIPNGLVKGSVSFVTGGP